MQRKEKIYHELTTMNSDELRLLYEHILFIQHAKPLSPSRRTQQTIEEILQMTNSAPGCWSETVKEERMERI